MNFWEGETCQDCGGAIVERHVTLHRVTNGHDVLIEDLPAGVCIDCGIRYFAANVLKTMEETVQGRRKADRQEAET